MKMLEKKDYQEIRTWIHRNARPLDMALWNYYFEKGRKEDVADALAYYQNEDGGFGNAVEPDCWNSESSPYATLIAAGILRQTEFIEDAGTEHPMVQGILRYLDSGVHSDEEGWFFSIPSNNDCPRAPWGTYSEEENKAQEMGVTAFLCSFIIRYGDKDSGLYKKAIHLTRMILDKAAEAENFGEMGAGGVSILVGELMQSGLSSSFECGALIPRLAEVANSSIERDPEKWAGYTPRPSEFIFVPDSPLYKGNEDIVNTELDYLIDTRNPGGVWSITWSWFDLGEKYPKEFAISENWWMASKAIEKLRFLINFGRVNGI